MNERLEGLFTKDQLDKLRDANILLVGVGGVGSFCFEVLLRCGINNFTLIDFDEYEISNLNRQLHSSVNNVGKNKVDVLKEYALTVNPDVSINVSYEKIDKDTRIDFFKYNYIIDACDDVEAKYFLIKKAKENNIKIICALGAGNKLDSRKLKVTKLSKTSYDPLAKRLRTYLRKQDFCDDVMVVSSDEAPFKSDKVKSYIGVTSVSGILLADYVIKDLIK